MNSARLSNILYPIAVGLGASAIFFQFTVIVFKLFF
jgi:hypothetical protein